MEQKFDVFNRAESPALFLCNPDFNKISSIITNNRKISLRYGDTSEFSFVVYDTTTDNSGNNIVLDYFEKIQVKRLVLIEDVGYFQITDVQLEDDGVKKYKNVKCRSLQNEINSKTIILQQGVYPLFDPLALEAENISDVISELVPDWTLDIDAAITGKYRTFDNINKGLLEFLYNDIKEAFECIVLFDFLNKKISFKAVTTLKNNIHETSIYMSFRNLLNKFVIEEKSDDIVTCLAVHGQDIDISEVNPLGTQFIYNFDYYKNSNWMTQDLIDSIDDWQDAYNAALVNYDTQISLYHTHTSELDVINNALRDFNGELTALIQVRDARIEQGLDISEQTLLITNKEAQMASKQNERNTKLTQIEAVTQAVKNISSSVSFEENFTPEQLMLLKKYTFEQEYRNDYYLVTTDTDNTERRQILNDLYEEGANALERMSQPRWTFQVDSSNFMFIKDFASFTEQLELGCMVTVEMDEDKLAYPILLEINYNLDDVTDFSLVFGNRFQLSDSMYTYADLLESSAATASRTNASWTQLTSFNRNYEDKVSDFLENAFDVSKKEIINSVNQEQRWDSSGLLFRKMLVDDSGYDDRQIKIINNKIVFTDDNWNTVKTVIGEIPITDGGTTTSMYGVACEVLVGNLIAGNRLVISNENNTFRIDGTGFYFVENNEDKELSEYINQNVQDAIATDAHGLVRYLWFPAGSVDVYQEYYNIGPSELHDAHVGHVWYNTTNGKTYTYTKQTGATTGRYDYYWSFTELEIPQELYDTIDGKKTVFTKRPSSFAVNDIWVYEGKYNSATNPTSDLYESNSPPTGFYQTPYASVTGGQYTYYKQGDLLIAKSDSTNYNPASWIKYSPNLSKGNDTFLFRLDNDGMVMENGQITLLNPLNRIQLDPSDGFKISKNTGTSSVPVWADKFYLDSNTGDIIMEGKITAVAGGKVGGWDIGEYSLSSGSGSSYVALNSKPSDTFAIWAGSNTASSAPFRVTRDGVVTATNINITGGNYTGGTIGGWTVNNYGFYKDDFSGGIGLLSNQIISMYAGTTYANRNNAPFQIRFDGYVYATTGSIGGWTLGTDSIYRNSSVWGNINGLYFGNSGLSIKDKFRVDSNGTVYSSSVLNGYNLQVTDTTSGIVYGRLSFGAAASGYNDALYLESSGSYALKLRSGGNMSVDTAYAGTVYIGTLLYSGSGQTVEIGAAESAVKLYGTVTAGNSPVLTQSNIINYVTFQ